MSPTYDCCALCSMFSCDCGPGDPCMNFENRAIEEIPLSMYGRSIEIKAGDLVDQKMVIIGEAIEKLKF